MFYYFQNSKIWYPSCIIPLLDSLYSYIHFLVISFAWYKEYIMWRISFSKFSDVLPAFTCGSAIGILWSICLGVWHFSCLDKPRGCAFPCVCFSIGNILLTKSLKTFCLPLRSLFEFWKLRAFFLFSELCGFVDSLSLSIS